MSSQPQDVDLESAITMLRFQVREGHLTSTGLAVASMTLEMWRPHMTFAVAQAADELVALIDDELLIRTAREMWAER